MKKKELKIIASRVMMRPTFLKYLPRNAAWSRLVTYLKDTGLHPDAIKQIIESAAKEE